MILHEIEPVLPVVVQQAKVQVLHCLASNHATREYLTVGDLATFLDQVLAGLKAAMPGRPGAGLTRVVLFWRTPAAMRVVEDRMARDGSLHSFQQPACWLQLGQRLPDLQRWAERLEPGWTTRKDSDGVRS
jgi:hypothetical protein